MEAVKKARKTHPHGNDVQQTVAELGPWFHNLHLPDGAQTAPHHFLGDFPAYKWSEIAPFVPEDLQGWSALDVGCNAGFYCFELARRGAHVVGVDTNIHYLKQARWAAEQFGLETSIEFKQMQVYDLAHLDALFDIVLFLGVFYHLRYPLLGLDIVAQKTRHTMVFQTLSMLGDDVVADTLDRDFHDRAALTEPGWPKMAFIEHRFANDATNWWVPNHACVEAMLRSTGMRVVATPGKEVYVCEPDPSHPSCVTTWDADEFLSATGRSNNRFD